MGVLPSCMDWLTLARLSSRASTMATRPEEAAAMSGVAPWAHAQLASAAPASRLLRIGWRFAQAAM